MTHRTHQNILLIGCFVLLALVILSPLLERRERVEGPPEPKTETVNAATTVKVWVHKNTGLYYCPDSKVYGKSIPGLYMTQGDALERGYRPAGQEPCR
jgi:hypothetical protein